MPGDGIIGSSMSWIRYRAAARGITLWSGFWWAAPKWTWRRSLRSTRPCLADACRRTYRQEKENFVFFVHKVLVLKVFVFYRKTLKEITSRSCWDCVDLTEDLNPSLGHPKTLHQLKTQHTILTSCESRYSVDVSIKCYPKTSSF